MRIRQYKEYMQSNGVKGDIILNEVPIYSNNVMIDTIHYSTVPKQGNEYGKRTY